MLSDIIIASGDNLWEGLAVLIIAVVSAIGNYVANKAKEKREREKFEETGRVLKHKPESAASGNDAEGWQRVSVVKDDLAAFLLKAKRNRTKLKQQREKKSSIDYHQVRHEAPGPVPMQQNMEGEETPHLDTAPLPSEHQGLGGTFHQDMLYETPAPQPVPVAIPVVQTPPPPPAPAKYVFQHDEKPQLMEDADDGESSTHRIVANAVEPQTADEQAAANGLAVKLRNKNEFRRALIMSEILAAPLALRKKTSALWDI